MPAQRKVISFVTSASRSSSRPLPRSPRMFTGVEIASRRGASLLPFHVQPATAAYILPRKSWLCKAKCGLLC